MAGSAATLKLIASSEAEKKECQDLLEGMRVLNGLNIRRGGQSAPQGLSFMMKEDADIREDVHDNLGHILWLMLEHHLTPVLISSIDFPSTVSDCPDVIGYSLQAG